MMESQNEVFAPLIGVLGIGMFVILAIVVGIIVVALKGWALWIAVKNNHKIWFIVLLVLNTFGILELIYIFLVGKKVLKEKEEMVEVEEPEAENEKPKASL